MRCSNIALPTRWTKSLASPSTNEPVAKDLDDGKMVNLLTGFLFICFFSSFFLEDEEGRDPYGYSFL